MAFASKGYVVTRVKICCNRSIEEAHLAVRAGASALGLVSDMPSGPGVISEVLIAEIAATRVTERGGRADDKRSESAMEDRKKEGYF